MTDRERLIELLTTPTPIVEGGNTVGEKRLSYYLAENIADKLLANGVTLPPVTVGQKVYQTDGVQIYGLTVRKVIYETEGVAFSEEAIGNSIFLSAEQAGMKISAELAKKKLTYEEFKADMGPTFMEISEHDRLGMYAAYLNDDAEDRE